ncbi:MULTISPECIES: hypothetical protein [unclassified Microbacterium]|uniref:hypothetical protein n=1 Tax=unclassified Microbacterium TaxID=2609290 RepID=UPI000EA9CD8D|nr:MULTISPECIES: hypothetical protein [unclassified Microbacterium]MBT2484572.1 hypothetical protein [Microbacterium sp. ISL-108]RKN67468.1 hypothetical protein D7252_07665 [Microbacterium sp. CGR2]
MNKTTFPPSDPLTWKQADSDVHVATRDGEFAGFVEIDGAAHAVRDNHGADLGTYDSLEEARLALESAHAPERRALSLPFRVPRTLRRRPRRARA